MATDAGGNQTRNYYGSDGALNAVSVGGAFYLEDVLHNAKGQREAAWYANGTKTSYTYDALSQRLKRLLTVNLNSNEIVQDLNYFYDAVGNITTIRDDAQQTLFFDNTIVIPDQYYTYDALYRLIVAQGREQIGLATFGADDNYNDSAWQTSHKGDATATQRYTQKYSYDAVGNMLVLQHLAGSGSYTRTYDIATASNRLNSTTVGTQDYNYMHDTRGNMVTMPHLSAMDYDLLNQMSHVTAGTVDAYYQYSGGQRVRKYVDKGGGLIEERIYFGGFEIYRKYLSGTIDVERSTVHVQDDMGRIAMLEVRNTSYNSDGSAAILKRYVYSNHLGSAALELDDAGDIISYEEYHPYGTTAYQATNANINAVAKRYRFTGKERDEETALNYHGARYYALWLCRWCAVDPLEAKFAGWSSYNYCFCNPINYTDGSGMGPEKKLVTKVVQQPTEANKNVTGTVVMNGEGNVTELIISAPRTSHMESPISFGSIPIDFSPRAIQPDNVRISLGPTPQQLGTMVDYQEAKALQTARANAYLDQPFIGQTFSGTSYTVTRRGIAEQEKRQNEAYGEAVRGGPVAAIGGLVGGKEMAIRWSAVDGVMMSFAGVGTPYGKVEISSVVSSRNVAYSEKTIAESSTLPNGIASTFMGGKYTSRVLEQMHFFIGLESQDSLWVDFIQQKHHKESFKQE